MFCFFILCYFIPKLWKILKCFSYKYYIKQFSRQLIWSHISNFCRVHCVSDINNIKFIRSWDPVLIFLKWMICWSSLHWRKLQIKPDKIKHKIRMFPNNVYEINLHFFFIDCFLSDTSPINKDGTSDKSNPTHITSGILPYF